MTTRCEPATVDEVVRARRSTRAYLDRPVDPVMLRDLLSTAARAPSGGNLQPWRLFVLANEALARFKSVIGERVRVAPKGEDPEYSVYPTPLPELYAQRRFECGEALYAALEIARTDKARRRGQFADNFAFFGAPVGLFCFVDRRMGAPQWADLGMFLQTLMLLLKTRGIDTCAQEAWSLYPRTVCAYVSAPVEMMLFCGMAIGYADPHAPINRLQTPRASVEQFTTFLGFP
jgi:nitroreductase